MPYGCSSDLVLQTCARRSRPARSCWSHTVPDKGKAERSKGDSPDVPAKHALPAHTWAEVIGILTARLADSIDRNGAVRRDDPRLRLAERLSGRAGGAF